VKVCKFPENLHEQINLAFPACAPARNPQVRKDCWGFDFPPRYRTLIIKNLPQPGRWNLPHHGLCVRRGGRWREWQHAVDVRRGAKIEGNASYANREEFNTLIAPFSISSMSHRAAFL
jgi:hypothetical protein